MKPELVKPEAWAGLRRWTGARIALGRAGASMPTGAALDFQLDHAKARDAVHAALHVDRLAEDLERAGFQTLRAASQAHDRAAYLKRPDLGRRLAPHFAEALLDRAAPAGGRLTVVVADGLSAQAPAAHALPLLLHLREALAKQDQAAGRWEMDSVVLATQARVALGDEVGALRGAEAVLVLLGERPGLKSPDSLGAYLTYRPRAGRTDAERNCVSNIRPEGLPYPVAALRLAYLLQGARRLQASGTCLKDESGDAPEGTPHLP